MMIRRSLSTSVDQYRCSRNFDRIRFVSSPKSASVVESNRNSRKNLYLYWEIFWHSHRSVSAMDTNSSGSTILYLQFETNFPQKKCLSVINLDAATVNTRQEMRRFLTPGPKSPKKAQKVEEELEKSRKPRKTWKIVTLDPFAGLFCPRGREPPETACQTCLRVFQGEAFWALYKGNDVPSRGLLDICRLSLGEDIVTRSRLKAFWGKFAGPYPEYGWDFPEEIRIIY